MKFRNMCLFFIMSSLGSLYAQEGSIAKKDRLYIGSGDVAFKNNEIYVSVNNNWVQTNAVYSDTSGVYVDQNSIGWTCGYGHYNTTNVWTCDKCGRRRE